jgi:hypothetical protein
MRGKANCRTRLRQRGSAAGLAAYDALPAPLRQWLADAALPWSATSARRVWQRAIKASKGDLTAARAALDRAEARLLSRDAPRIWGPGHPACQSDCQSR